MSAALQNLFGLAQDMNVVSWQVVHFHSQGGSRQGGASTEGGIHIPGGWYDRPERVASADTHVRIAPDGTSWLDLTSACLIRQPLLRD